MSDAERIKTLETALEFSAKMLNQRVDVENLLINVARGDHPPLTPEDCKVLALRLGTPRVHWSDYLKNHKFGGVLQ